MLRSAIFWEFHEEMKSHSLCRELMIWLAADAKRGRALMACRVLLHAHNVHTHHVLLQSIEREHDGMKRRYLNRLRDILFVTRLRNVNKILPSHYGNLSVLFHCFWCSLIHSSSVSALLCPGLMWNTNRMSSSSPSSHHHQSSGRGWGMSHAEAHLYLLLCWFLSLDYLVAADQTLLQRVVKRKNFAFERIRDCLRTSFLTHHIISSSFSGRDESFVCIKLN